MYCSKCGAKVSGGRFCSNCGAYLGGTDIYGTPISDVPVSSDPGVGTKRVHKIAYALLALFLGCFGVHRFYAGRVLSGVVYIVFFWTGVPYVLSIVEGVLALTRESDGSEYIPVDPDRYFV